MNQVRNYDRQIWNVQSLETKRDYEVFRYEVRDIPNTPYVIVSREYRRPGHKNLSFADSYRVGPRGGMKLIYDNIHC